MVLVIFQILQSLALLSYGGYRVAATGWPSRSWELSLEFLVIALGKVITSGVGLLVLGLLTLAISLQLFGLKGYAWLLAMSIQGIILFTSLIAYFRDEPNFFLMASAVVLVFYLNQNEIRVVMCGGQEKI
jgi:hypothetical protein